MNDFNLDGKVAAVTGAASGIGKSVSVEFGQAGAKVFILDVDAGGARSTAEEIQTAGGQAEPLVCDVSNRRQVLNAFDRIFAQEARLHILVNNAGIAHIGSVESTSEEDFERVFRVNVKGVFNCLHAVIGRMKEQGGGVILNIASVAATVGIKERFAYSMSKGAVLTMTYQVARDYVTHGIRCNSISPARVHTPFVDNYLEKHYAGREEEVMAELAATQPIGRMGRPEEVAALARYLCSDAAAFVTGTDFPLDGGFIRLNT